MMTTFQEAVTELKNIRENGIRSSKRIVQIYVEFISNRTDSLSYDVWVILEQVFIAALDTHCIRIAQECLITLHQEFPTSARIRRLFGMYLECIGDFTEAKKVYSFLVKEDPANTLARKRFISILKAQNRLVEAIEELNKYLKIFMADYDAWSELSDIYISNNDFKKAAYCLEELILSNPQNYFYISKYADIKYSEGGLENFELARSYYCQACLLNSKSLRSLYGLFLSTSAIASISSNSGSKNLLSLLSSSDSKNLEASNTDLNSLASTIDKDSKKTNLNLAIWAVRAITQFEAPKPHLSYKMPKDLKLKIQTIIADENSSFDESSTSQMIRMSSPLSLKNDQGDLILRKLFVLPVKTDDKIKQQQPKIRPGSNKDKKVQEESSSTSEEDQCVKKRVIQNKKISNKSSESE